MSEVNLAPYQVEGDGNICWLVNVETGEEFLKGSVKDSKGGRWAMQEMASRYNSKVGLDRVGAF